MPSDAEIAKKTPEQAANLAAQEEQSFFDRLRSRAESAHDRIESVLDDLGRAHTRIDELTQRVKAREGAESSAVADALARAEARFDARIAELEGQIAAAREEAKADLHAATLVQHAEHEDKGGKRSKKTPDHDGA